MSDDPPYRRPGLGASPVLAQLAEIGDDRRREMPRDAEAMADPGRRRRLEQVFQVSGHDATMIGLGAFFTWTLLIPLCGAITAQDGSSIPLVFGVGAAVAVTAWAMVAAPRRQAERQAAVTEGLAWAARLPFPVRGYDVWCLSEHPLFDVVLSAPVDRQQLASAVAAVDPTVQVEWIDERTPRLHVPPRTASGGDGPAEWYADPAALRRVFERLLLPLHTDVPIERVDMGGSMHKR